MMKNITFLIVAIFFLIACSQEPKYDLVITNVNLIDGTGTALQPNVNVYVKDQIITQIDADTTYKGKHVIDGTGKYLIPGLFDCHVHPGDSYEKDLERLMHYGITSIFIPGGSSCTDETFALMRELGSQDSIPAPRVFHSSHHFTMKGRHPFKTYPSSKWVEGETIFYLRDTAQIAQLVEQESQQPILGIKLTIEDGPAPPFVDRIPQAFVNKTVEEAKKYGLEVFAHVSDNEELQIAVEGGAQNLVHYTGVNIDPDDSTHLSWIEQLKKLDASWVTTLMIDKSFLYPMHLEWFEDQQMLSVYQMEKKQISEGIVIQAEFYSKLLMEEYGIESDGLEDFIVPQVRDIRFLMDQGINMVLGTDAGNDFNFYGYSLHEEMQLMAMGGMAPLDIIKMGTLNAAKMMHAEDSLGTVEVGKYADMILLEANPLEDIKNTLNIHSIFKGGKLQERID